MSREIKFGFEVEGRRDFIVQTKRIIPCLSLGRSIHSLGLTLVTLPIPDMKCAPNAGGCTLVYRGCSAIISINGQSFAPLQYVVERRVKI